MRRSRWLRTVKIIRDESAKDYLGSRIGHRFKSTAKIRQVPMNKGKQSPKYLSTELRLKYLEIHPLLSTQVIPKR